MSQFYNYKCQLNKNYCAINNDYLCDNFWQGFLTALIIERRMTGVTHNSVFFVVSTFVQFYLIRFATQHSSKKSPYIQKILFVEVLEVNFCPNICICRLYDLYLRLKVTYFLLNDNFFTFSFTSICKSTTNTCKKIRDWQFF